jgi:hypothetical protein
MKRSPDIKRTAEEHRATLLARENKDARQELLNYALVYQEVTDAEYRVLSLELKHTDADGLSRVVRTSRTITSRRSVGK